MDRIAPQATHQEADPVDAATQVHQLASSLVSLLLLELKLACKRAPQVLLLALLLVPLLLLSWLGLTLLLSYGLFLMSNMVWLGLTGFLLINIAGLVAICWLLQRWKQQLSLPQTRSAIHYLVSSLHQEPTDELT